MKKTLSVNPVDTDETKPASSTVELADDKDARLFMKTLASSYKVLGYSTYLSDGDDDSILLEVNTLKGKKLLMTLKLV